MGWIRALQTFGEKVGIPTRGSVLNNAVQVRIVCCDSNTSRILYFKARSKMFPENGQNCKSIPAS